MAHASVQELRAEWQTAVAAHAAVFRDGRMRGLTRREIDEIAQGYALRVDSAYSRLKEAEAAQAAAVETAARAGA